MTKTHQMCWTRIYDIWRWMKQRCNYKKHNRYNSYWWKWIKNEWNSFEEFYNDMFPTYKEWLTIDRIDNNLNYSKNNCRWATYKEQWRNTTTNRVYKWKCIAEWCEILWLNRNTIDTRLSRWWTYEKALWINNI